MQPEETVFRSPLEKPLCKLTEDDVSQLTREDCRRYLKEKGMRRPSWNKSQAIEQVISLKTLLETGTESESDAGFRPKIHVSREENPPHVPLGSEKVARTDIQISVSASESVPYRRIDPPKPSFSGDVSCLLPAPGINASASRDMGIKNRSVGQMTIFYCGKVNVYDGMPADKAQAILQLVASPIYLSQDTPSAGTAAVRSFPCQLPATSIRPGRTSGAVSLTIQNGENSRQCNEEVALSREVEPEGPTSRKASLQRYLEKRKDRGRFKSKKKTGASPSSGLEMYFNHQVRGLNPIEQSSRSGTCSPPQPRPPLHTPIHSSSVDNQTKNVGLSVDLNDDDLQEA